MIATLAAAAIAAAAFPSAAPCQAPLPAGPPVPAPIVLETSCGGFRLGTDGRVTGLAPDWFSARSGGTGRLYGDELRVRRNPAGRITLLRDGRVIWRSQHLYPNDAADVAFGPGAFAFSSYRRGVFLTDLESPERLVVAGRARYPSDFFASGRLIVAASGRITVLSPTGTVERRASYSRRGGYTFDRERNTLYFVTPSGRLATLQESRLQIGRQLDANGAIGFSTPGLLLFYGSRSLAATTLDGRLIAQTHWPRSRLDVFDSGATVSGDGRHIAFRRSDAKAGAKSGTAVLYVLDAGDTRASAVFRHRLGPIGCGVGANMRWNGRHLLYSTSEGDVAIVDAAGRARNLATLLEAIPQRAGEQPTAGWLDDYPAPRASAR